MAWNRPTERVQGTGSRDQGKFPFRCLVVGAIVAISAGFAAWFIFSPSGVERHNAAPTRNTHIKEVKPSVPRKVVTEDAKSKIDAEVKPKVSEKTVEKLSRIEAIVRKRMVNTNGTIYLEKPLLKDPTDQLYLDVFCRELGDMPPTTPKLPEKEEIKAVLAVGTKLLPEKDDTEDILAAKEIVNEVKDALNQYMSEGGTINQFFDYYCDKLEAAFELRQQAIISLNDVVKNDDTKTGLEYIAKVNEKLSEQGIKPIEFTKMQLVAMEYNATNETE